MRPRLPRCSPPMVTRRRFRFCSTLAARRPANSSSSWSRLRPHSAFQAFLPTGKSLARHPAPQGALTRRHCRRISIAVIVSYVTLISGAAKSGRDSRCAHFSRSRAAASRVLEREGECTAHRIASPIAASWQSAPYSHGRQWKSVAY